MTAEERHQYIKELRATQKILGPGWYADGLELLIDEEIEKLIRENVELCSDQKK